MENDLKCSSVISVIATDKNFQVLIFWSVKSMSMISSWCLTLYAAYVVWKLVCLTCARDV